MLAQTCLALAASSLAAVSAIVLPFKAIHHDVEARAGAPITAQKLEVSNLTTCGVANVSWTGPGVEPYSLEIKTGGYYVNSSFIASYANISNTSSVYWIVNQTADTSMFFEITDAAGQKTHLQNLLVADPANATFVPSELANGTLVCPQGEGLVNATYAASFE